MTVPVPVVVSFLWPKNAGVLLELAAKGNFDIVAPQSVVEETLAGKLEAIGRQYIPLIASEFPSYAAAATPEANARYGRFAQALPELLSTPSAATPETTQRSVAVMQDLIPTSLRNAMAVIDELDALLSKRTIAAVLVNETDVVSGRLLALWAKERGIPSFLLSHGSNIGRAYSVTACMLADYLLVFGPRGKETYLEIGIPAEKMAVTGNPGWDRYPDVLAAREQYRKDAYARLHLRADEPLVLFATVSHTKLTTLLEPDITEQTARSFMKACRQMREAGAKFNVVFKDRPSNAEFGKSEIYRIAAEEGFTDFAYGVGDMEAYLVAADLVVSCNSNTFVEAMAAGVAAVNLWMPSTWFLGPGFDATDGIPMVPCENPVELASVMRRILEDAEHRAKLIAQMKSRLPFYHLAMDGRSTSRVVDAVLAVLKGAPPQANGIAAEQSAVSDKKFIGLLGKVPRRVLILGREGGRIEAELRKSHPAASVHITRDRGNVAPGSIDTLILANILEETFDPQALLNELRAALTADAQVIVAVPNARNLWFIREMLAGRWTYQAGGFLDPARLRYFSLKNIIDLFASSGFAVERVESQRDPRITGLPDATAGPVTVEIDTMQLKNLNAQDLMELSTREFFIGARPV